MPFPVGWHKLTRQLLQKVIIKFESVSSVSLPVSHLFFITTAGDVSYLLYKDLPTVHHLLAEDD